MDLISDCLEKRPVAWKKFCAENWLKELQKTMGRCTGRRDITEITSKPVLNIKQSISLFSQTVLVGV